MSRILNWVASAFALANVILKKEKAQRIISQTANECQQSADQLPDAL